jgi:hypothetical protein
MTGPSTSLLYTALAFHRAWTSDDLDRAMAHPVRDIVCHTPMGPINGAAQLRAFLGSFSHLIARSELVAAFGDTRVAVLIHHPRHGWWTGRPRRRVPGHRQRRDHRDEHRR